MTKIESIELARAYVALSNTHRVELIQSLFAKDAIYRSSAVGDYQGVAAIATMMESFFARYPDVHWRAQNYHCAANRVSFDFEMQARDAQDGSQLQRNGVEQIEFDSRGSIKMLEVDAS